MTDLEILKKIEKSGSKTASTITDAFEVCRAISLTDKEFAQKRIMLYDNAVNKRLADENTPPKEKIALRELSKKMCLFLAPDYLDYYIRYMEFDREPQKRFYLPRRKQLLPLVNDLQDLADRKIDFLGISLPSRVGKSTLCIFFITWMMGKYPDDASVMSGHSDKLTDGFYREVLSLITDNTTYKWADVFPNVPFVGTSAKNETIDLNTSKRFPTFTARSISGTLTGAVEIGSNGVLYSDDLVEDLEESLSAERLQAKYDAYLNQLKDRKKEGAMELMVGTRWNILDPLGRVQDQYADNPRYRFTVMPALDENGESNFDYQYGLGFTTAYYMDMKASIDDATWCAKYMGQPYVREGLLFPREELRRYYELPKDDPDGIVSICDTKTTGTDYQFMPVAYQYGNDLYIEDCVCNNGSIEALDGLCAEILLKHGVKLCRFESNVAGGRTADQVQELVKSKGGVTHITKKYTTQNKETKIIMSSPSIKARCLFKDDSAIERGSDYAKMMSMLCTYTVAGKNKNDDVPDGLSQLMLFVESLQNGKVEVFYRPF